MTIPSEVYLIIGILFGTGLVRYGIGLGVKLAEQIEGNERDFATRLGQIDNRPLEQETTDFPVGQETTGLKGIEDLAPENRSDLFEER